MRTMNELVNEILNLNDNDMELLAEALVWFGDRQATKLEFLLQSMQVEKNEKECV